MTTPDHQHQALIAEGQPLVYSLATVVWRRLPIKIDLEDLVAYGQVGLAEAAIHFDRKRGSQFTTFAYYRIKGAMYDGVSKMSWTSRGRLNRMRLRTEAAMETANDVHQCAPGSGPADTPANSQQLVRVILSGQCDPLEGGRHEASLEDPLGTPATLLANREIFQRLSLLVKALPHLRRVIIESVYYEGMTLQDAANRLGISKSWASRVHAQTLEQLAMALRKVGGDE